MRLNSLPIVFLALAAFAHPVCAQNILDLGNIPDPDTSGPLAMDISGDGSVIVGNAVFQFMSDWRPFRWTEADGMVGLGLMAGSRSCEALGISSDGSLIVGNCSPAGGGGGKVRL